VEFFYNAGNATGSVLSPRQDVSYNTGCVAGNGFFTSGDIIAFVGIETGGTLGLYTIENFRLQKKSGMSIDDYLSNSGLVQTEQVILSMSLVNDHYLVYVSAADSGVDGSGDPTWDIQRTLVFDNTLKVWCNFEFNGKDIGGFPVIDTADRVQGSSRAVTMMMVSGEICEFTSVIEPQDQTGEGNYFLVDDSYLVDTSDYIADGTPFANTNISMSITLPEFDGGISPSKFCHALWVVGRLLKDGGDLSTMDISWSDDHYTTFSTPRTLATTMDRKLTRLGNFNRRAHKIDYSGADSLRIEALELDIRGSKYA
jgi:hypothetical protein